MALTMKHLDAMYGQQGWEGYGYLSCRLSLKPHFRVGADRMLLDWANENRLSEEELFTFANSRYGRFYGNSWEDGGKNAHQYLPQLDDLRDMVKIRL